MYELMYDIPENIIWKRIIIDGVETNYSVSNVGNIRNEITKRNLIPHMHKGYTRISITVNGKQYSILVHILVARAFIDNPDNKPYVNHIDGIKTNNSVINLEWCTPSENSIHAHKIGLIPNKNKSCKKTDKETVHKICKILETNPDKSLVQIAKDLNVSRHVVMGIFHKESFTDISKKYNIDNYTPTSVHPNYGDANGKTIIPDSDIHEICKMIDSGKYSLRDISDITDIDYQTIRNVYYGTCRKNISSLYNFSKSDAHVLYQKRLCKVIEICNLLDSGFNTKQVSELTDMPRSMIRNIYSGNSWVEVSSKYDFYKNKEFRKKKK